jgi:hypothetical protein
MSRRLEDPKHPRPRRTLRERVVALAMVVLALNVTAVAIFLAAWLAGWIRLSAGGAESDQWRFQFTLNAGRVAEDMQKTASSLRTASEVDTVIGDVVHHDRESGRVIVRDKEGAQVTARINDATEIEGPASMPAGERVELIYRHRDGENQALRIELLEEE